MEYIGKISEILEDGFSVRVVIPGVCEDLGMPALPGRGELDEPKIGDIVLVNELDPVFGSVLLYEKLKQNKFNGFRYHGKAISLNDDEIIIQTFDQEEEYQDDSLPEGKSYIKITSENNIEINSEQNLQITVSNGEVKLNANNITLEVPTTINGTITIDGTCSPSGSPQGGFNCIPVCPFTGAVHQSNQIMS